MKRSKSNTYYNFNVATAEELDPILQKIYDGLCNGENKKVLSNKYKVPMTTVITLSKRFKTGTISDSDLSNMEQKTDEPKSKVIQINNDYIDPDEISNVEEDNDKPRKKRKNVSQEDIDLIIEFAKDGYTSKQIAELTGLSESTVSRIRVNNGVRKYNIKSPDSENKDFIPINNSVRVGLVADRHTMPVNDFIFKEALSKDLMFDYDKIEEICRDYIKDMLDFDEDGKAIQTLVVYVTGIQCASSSLIKVTNEMKVNLTLRHYDTDTKTYHTQVIWDKFGNCLPEELGELLVNSRNSYTYKCDVKEILKNGSLAKLAEAHYDDNSNLEYQDMYLVTDTSAAFELANKKVQEADEKNEKLSIYVKGYDLKNGRFVANGFDLKLRTRN